MFTSACAPSPASSPGELLLVVLSKESQLNATHCAGLTHVSHLILPSKQPITETLELIENMAGITNSRWVFPNSGKFYLTLLFSSSIISLAIAASLELGDANPDTFL